MVLESSEDRRLTTIMAIDVVGYSRLMSEDEVGTLSALKEIRGSVLVPLVKQFGGRIFKLMGDGALVEFPSVIKAVQCAVELQAAMASKSSELFPDRAIQLRVGINLGDVVAMGSDLYGAGVNLASRLEGLAEPGGISISSSVHEHVTANPAWAWRDLGDQTVKNFAKPVRVYSFMSPVAAPIVDISEAMRAKPAIAVLPLANMSGDPEQEFFADGLTEEILTELSRFRGLLVISRNSTFKYKGQAIDIRRV